ncbi:hypothetical protein, partial [Pseudomonas aeruginosa]|uniref:hypothetical protein n=1 Tax=Pseudomonas aeruginosa TaxID=287 RepID=UPI003CC640E6
VFDLTRIDEWFLEQNEDHDKDEEKVKTLALSSIHRELMYKLKRKGFSDARMAKLLGVTQMNQSTAGPNPTVRPVLSGV